MLLKLLVFLIGLGLGVLFVAKTDAIERITGPVGWAQRTFGGGGTNTFYKLLGVALIVIGTMYATGMIDRVVGGFVRSVFGQG